MLDDLWRRNYSPDTIRGYIRAVQQFAEYFGRLPEQMGAEELRRYQIHLLYERKLALGTVENNISALRFLYRKTLKHRDLAFDDLPFPKQPHTLPTVLSQDEVTRLIEAAASRMHRMLLMLLYATGMRRTEASLLKVRDIDSQRMVIHIQRGKGLRDRDLPLTPKLLEALRDYWRSLASIYFPVDQVIAALNGPSPTKRCGMSAGQQPSAQAFRRGLARIVSATLSPPTCWNPEPICAPSNYCWVMNGWKIRPSICICRSVICMPPSTRSTNSRCVAYRSDPDDTATLRGGRCDPYSRQQVPRT
jgi:integrase